ncbi:MAG TPA: peptidyl-prolyl cis-trans isomerase [Cycloclasticus sp.]|jgi:peptidyl-prolyl cis-trans isomerase B (cyclophilin B)|nr:peptidyl-prolyl cis-trans isomerase [Cycloclasticus sp.]HIL91513.1 peptidyl-prolyl cis-trans isomerase [Cycloclasticus sp.]
MINKTLLLRTAAFFAVLLSSTLLYATDTSNMTIIKFTTNQGEITLELDGEKAPNTVKNFVAYIEDGFYEGTIFHRIIPNFMAQGGGFTSEFQQKPVKNPIENEADNGLKNDRGTIAMARTGDPHSATGQFFINLKDNDFLNHSSKTQQGWGYAVFGKVTDGMDTIDKMAAIPTGSGGMFPTDVPQEEVIIEKAEVVK